MMMLKLTQIMASPSGQRLANMVMSMVQKENLPLDQGVQDMVGFLEKLQQASELSGKSVKEVVDESIALFRSKHGG